MTRMQRTPAHGFSLIELLVALSITAVLSTAAIAVVVQTNQAQSAVLARSALVRDTGLVMDMLGKDLSYAGAGVPRGYRIDENDFTGGVVEDHQLRPLVRVGGSDHIAFVGDLPYPNAELNGITTIADLGPAFDSLFVTSELSPCVPMSSSPGNYSCPNETRALVPGPGGGAFAAGDRCTQGGGVGKRLCPWGMNKWQGSGANPIQLVLGGVDGTWYERRWDRATTASKGGYFGITFTGGRPSGNSFSAGPVALRNPDLVNRPAGQALFSANGGGFVANIDRVFWSFEKKGTPGTACPGPNQDCVLLRRQCWGPLVDPANANFPGVSATAFRSNKTPTNCTAPAQGTNWETVMTGVDSFALTYFDDTGAQITTPWDLGTAVDVESVAVDLVLSRKVTGSGAAVPPATYRTSQRFFLNNNGGLVSPPAPPGSPPPGPPSHGRGGCHHHCGRHGHGDHG